MFKLIINIIAKNILKLVVLIIATFTLLLWINREPSKSSVKYITKFKYVYGETGYVVKSDMGYNVHIISDDDKTVNIIGDTIQYNRVSDINYLYIGTSVVLYAIIFIGICIDISDYKSYSHDPYWKIRECYIEYLLSKVIVDKKDNIFNYVLDNKLISSKTYEMTSYNIKDAISNYLENKNLFLIYETDVEKRNKKIKKIL